MNHIQRATGPKTFKHATWQLIGQEKSPLLTIDNCLPELSQLLELGKNHEGYVSNSDDFYPGVRKSLSGDYKKTLTTIFSESLNAQAISSALPECLENTFAVANQAADSLLPIQCIPHFDSNNPRQWAAVHYLCDSEQGGTGFFRHRQSGFEKISPQRELQYQRLLQDSLVHYGIPKAAYLTGSCERFEQFYQVEAKFNRCIFYPSSLLHSGMINEKVNQQWPARLTITSLFIV